jgi:ribosomal protein S18 acetylase RimI-like enzyme
MAIKKLDNPVWYALTESHQNHAINYKNIKFYNPDYAPFGAIVQKENTSLPILEYSKLIKNFLIVGEEPIIPNSIILVSKLVGLQMIIYKKIDLPITNKIIELNDSHTEELLALVKFVYPEYFKEKTASLGRYYGIFKNEKLIAITGERMQMEDFTEVSAVITHPDYAGNGYAEQLIAHTVNNIFKQDKIPFLHVAETNNGPIKLYEKLGFATRRKINFWNMSS